MNFDHVKTADLVKKTQELAATEVGEGIVELFRRQIEAYRTELEKTRGEIPMSILQGRIAQLREIKSLFTPPSQSGTVPPSDGA